jgi:RNA-directed DNA polymerase
MRRAKWSRLKDSNSWDSHFERHVILTGISRKGYWRLSKTLATHTGMTNEWLEQQELLSIRTLWMKVQGYV